MPTYTVTLPAGAFDAVVKARIAAEITRIHTKVTGAATVFAQVLFVEKQDGDWFVGGKPLTEGQIFVHGQIRAGRSAIDRTRLLEHLRDAIATASGEPTASIWIYLVDLPARDMIEFGHILPEPGGESAWLDALPEADRRRMQGS